MIDHVGQQLPKLFVLDTNVLLHDAKSFRNFEDNDVVIPITVLEELDRFKKGNEDIHFQAREFLRQIDLLTGDILSEAGASLGEGCGKLRVVFCHEQDARLNRVFISDSPDNRILNTGLFLQRTSPERRVILISKDTNLRMKAKSLGLQAQDYINDKIESCDKLYTGRRIVENISTEQIDRFFQNGGAVDAVDFPEVQQPTANENFVLRNGSKSVLATFNAGNQILQRVEKFAPYGIKPRNAEQLFAIKALLDDDIKLVTLAGKAGTGKTILALASALECSSQYRQILLARPVVPLSNKDLGYLPGDISAKLDPYMQPLFDNLSVIRHQFGENDKQAQKINRMLEMEKLVITPLAYIRGRSLQRMYMIVDEAQNLTPHEVKTIITRAGEGTKVILTGDVQQIDHPYLDSLSNGLSYLINRMVGQPLYAHISLEKGERSDLADLASELL
ncbi:PhoH family protein [Blastopirellula sp. JC732]|uniref:PhoH family protein n=1 Tax=Blastopirellula sediminis TaxID=2894196 RepID=A0A9X1SH21_9BACT|nr:PhoH family protein [Blastopirellula sediminis]MCC9607386.1 PhoH family protein [Blastopirellula sediminis]MCC9629321.1 PhoH family protein [Blastopirellula sediminis]